MIYEVVLTDKAEDQLRDAALWWANLVAQQCGKYRCLFSVPSKNREEAPVLVGERIQASPGSHEIS